MNIKGEKPGGTGFLSNSGGGILGLSVIKHEVRKAVFQDYYCQLEVTTVKKSREYGSQYVEKSRVE